MISGAERLKTNKAASFFIYGHGGFFNEKWIKSRPLL